MNTLIGENIAEMQMVHMCDILPEQHQKQPPENDTIVNIQGQKLIVQSQQQPSNTIQQKLPMLKLKIADQPLPIAPPQLNQQEAQQTMLVHKQQVNRQQTSQALDGGVLMKIQQQQMHPIIPPPLIIVSHQTHRFNQLKTEKNCVRPGCNNRAIVSEEWKDEYCSQKCVILHCRSVFSKFQETRLSKDLP